MPTGRGRHRRAPRVSHLARTQRCHPLPHLIRQNCAIGIHRVTGRVSSCRLFRRAIPTQIHAQRSKRKAIVNGPYTLIERGLDPAGTCLFIVDGAKALSTVLRRTFGADVPIQRGQIHKARNIIDRLPARDHKRGRQTLRDAGTMEDADAAEAALRTRARSFEERAPDVARSILEGLDEILTLTRLGLPPELRRSLASPNIIESMHSVIRQTCRNVKRWQDARMALRWTAAGMLEAQKGFRRLKAYRQLPILRETLVRHRRMSQLEQERKAA